MKVSMKLLKVLTKGGIVMRSKLKFLMIVMALCLFLPGMAIGAPMLSIGDYNIELGEIVTVDVILSNAQEAKDSGTPLDTFSFRVGYDPLGLGVSNVTSGDRVPEGSKMWFQGSADNGVVNYFYSVFFPPRPELTDGVIASFDVEGLDYGVFPLIISDLAFSNATTVVDVLAGDPPGGVTVADTTVIPIPSTLLLLGSGLFGLVALRRKKSS
jgi:hypothetical protein